MPHPRLADLSGPLRAEIFLETSKKLIFNPKVKRLGLLGEPPEPGEVRSRHHVAMVASMLQLGETEGAPPRAATRVQRAAGASAPAADPVGAAAWGQIAEVAKASEHANAKLDSAIEYCVFRQDADGVLRAA